MNYILLLALLIASVQPVSGNAAEVPMVVVDTPIYSMPTRVSEYRGTMEAGTFVWNNNGCIQNAGGMGTVRFRPPYEMWLEVEEGFILVRDWTNVIRVTGVCQN